MTAANKVCLVVIDGWGLSLTATEAHHPNLVQYDAIANANTPVMSALMGQPSKASSSGLPDQDASQALTKMPCTALYAHGLAVGLPEGLMGNSEVGHLNIGAGRVVYQASLSLSLSIYPARSIDRLSLNCCSLIMPRFSFAMHIGHCSNRCCHQ